MAMKNHKGLLLTMVIEKFCPLKTLCGAFMVAVNAAAPITISVLADVWNCAVPFASDA